MTQINPEYDVLIVDGAFTPVTPDEFVTIRFEDIGTGADKAVDLPNDIDPQENMDILLSTSAIRIDFPSSADGRGFSIASALRRAGYRGHLRAKGHVLADQYPLALRAGFDAVEISSDLAVRQPERQWKDALSRIHTGYRERLMCADPFRTGHAA